MKEREKLSSRLGFILISAGCAVGLGNVWRFPFITGQYLSLIHIYKDTLKPESYFNLQDQTVLITKLSSDAVLEETPERKVADVALPFYEGQDLAERFANAVGSKEKKKEMCIRDSWNRIWKTSMSWWTAAT